MAVAAAALVASPGAAWAQQPEKRVALVIGNSKYRHVPALANTPNDARLMAATLKGLGFALVGDGALIDLDKPGFERAVRAFRAELQASTAGMFYYAGHGLQIQGVNYLVPVDANPSKPADADFELVDASMVMRQMEAGGTRLNVIVLDACRNNPFGGRGMRETGAGLAQMRPPKGTLISYATQPGNLASDGAADGNSPYTKALAEAMRRPGRNIFQVFNDVGIAVDRATGGVQQPWLSSSPIEGDFHFAGAGGVAPAGQAPTAAAQPRPARQPQVASIPPQAPRSAAEAAFARGHEAFQRRDYPEAMSGFRAAADLGHGEAMGGVGVLHAFGLGVKADQAEALRWMRNAAVALRRADLGLVNRLIASVDPHSALLAESEYQDMMSGTRGEFGGLGLEVTLEGPGVKVVTPIDDTPAARGGMKPGDVIVRIDGQSIEGLSLAEAVKRMRGPVGSQVRLTIARGAQAPFELPLTRAVVRVVALKPQLRDGSLGYVRITAFTEKAPEELAAALDGLARKAGGRLNGLVLDLRNSPGGLLDSGVKVAGSFLDGGTVIKVVDVYGAGAAAEHVHSAPANGDKLRGVPLVVLINGASAAAVEIVAGSLQARQRATVMGTRSFGKGSVQTIFPLGGDGAVKLTTAQYVLPNGRSIQGQGIMPDRIVLPAPEEQGTTPLTPLSAGAAAGAIDSRLIGTERDSQLAAALQELRDMAARRR